MGTRIKIKRGTKSSIIANKNTLEENEIVYSTDSGELAIKNSNVPDGLSWQVAKNNYNIEIGWGATNTSDYNQIAVGVEAFSASDDTISIGLRSSIGTNANSSIAIGQDAKVYAGTPVSNSNAIAIGYNAEVISSGGIALGSNSVVASNPYSIVIGKGSQNINADSITDEEASVVIGGNSTSGASGKNIIIGSGSSTADSNNIIIGNNIISDSSALVIGHDNDIYSNNTIIIGHGATAAGSNENHVQLGNSSFVTGNIGNRPIDLQGDLITHSMNVDTTSGVTISLYNMFANKPVGTVALFFFNGDLESSIESGFRFMDNTGPVTSIYSANSASNTVFTCKVVKIAHNRLAIYAFPGEGRSASGTFTITYHQYQQIMTLDANATIKYGVGTAHYGEFSGTLSVKFI